MLQHAQFIDRLSLLCQPSSTGHHAMVGQRPPGQHQATHRGLHRPGNPATGAMPGGVICSPPRRQPCLAAEGTGTLAAESGTRVGAQATGQTL